MLIQIHQTNYDSGDFEFISQIRLPEDPDELYKALGNEIKRIKDDFPLKDGMVWTVVPESSIFFVKTAVNNANNI